MSEPRELYPPIEPYEHGLLEVGDGHEVYWEQCGRRNGQPVLFLHGGPGAGCDEKNRRYFDPRVYRPVLFDQRGAGRSRPFGSVRANTTQHLMADIEKLRCHLGIDRWLVYGGSWGSALGLAYAEAYPDRVTGLILRSIFLGTQSEIDWFSTPSGAARFRPDAWSRFTSAMPAATPGHLVVDYHRWLFGENEDERRAAARAWTIWEGSICQMNPSLEEVEAYADSDVCVALARLESHYFLNRCFLEAGELLGRIDRVAHLPVIIVQGRHDLVCPPGVAWALHRAWPGSRLELVPMAGHSASEPPMRDALIRATDAFRE